MIRSRNPFPGIKAPMLMILLAALAAAPARSADFATQMMEATYKLFNQDSTATGFFVRPPGGGRSSSEVILVTAGHVLARMSGNSAVIVLRRTEAGGETSRYDFNITIRSENRTLWTPHPSQDLAVMRIKLPSWAASKALPYECLADEAALAAAKLHIVSPLYVMGFPTRFESGSAGYPVARHGSVASHPLLPVRTNKTFLADFITFTGDSGGPVFIPDPRRGAEAENSPPLVLGIVLAQFRHDETIKSMYEERTVHYPLSLATILQAANIREAIGRMGK